MYEFDVSPESINVYTLIKEKIDCLLEKEKTNSLTNVDFNEVWTIIVLLPLLRIESFLSASKHATEELNREQAVISGLFCRLFRMLKSAREIVCTRLMTEELSSIFCRMIIEDATNLLFLIKNNKHENFQAFIFGSLKAEKRAEKVYLDSILNGRLRNADKSIIDWEKGLLDSVNYTYKVSGTNSSEINGNKTRNNLSFEKRVEAIGLEALYPVYAIGSHAIHGDWVTLYKYSLDYIEEKDSFIVKNKDKEADIRQLNPINDLIYEVLITFINEYPGHEIDMSVINEMKNERNLINRFDRMHFNFLKKRPLLEGIA